MLRRKSEQGIALLTALVMVLLIALAAAAIMTMSAQQTEITAGTLEHKTAMYLIDAAAVLTRERIKLGLPDDNTYDIIALPGPNPPDIDIVMPSGGPRLGTVQVSLPGVTFPEVRDVIVTIDPDDPTVTSPDQFKRFL